MKKNLVTATCIILVVAMVAGLTILFLSNYCCTTAGEKIGALGGVLGGVLGALGAALAVFLTLSGQRRDEAETIRDAARREIQEFGRLVSGHLDTCGRIAAGTVRVTAQGLSTIMAMPRPVIYEAIADRIGRLERGENYVTFYARIAEAERLVAILAARDQPAGIGEETVPPPFPMRRNDVELVVTAWMDAASIALHILNPQPRPTDYDTQVELSFRNDLEEALRQARATFPDDSIPQPPT